MDTLSQSDFEDVLNLEYCCISCLKNCGKLETIISEISKTFKADEAVFLSANANYEGVNLANSYALCRDRSYLTQYADYFWRYDPLYKMQFCPTSINPVFKTDDIIPYSQMVKLEYYYSFLRPQNLLGELIIRLSSRDSTLGVISLQRYKEHQGFEKRDVLKASLLVPYLTNVFETASRFAKVNDERLLLEQWMELHSGGIILLDSEFMPIYTNSKARYFCQLLKATHEKSSLNAVNVETLLPQIIIQDCKNLTLMSETRAPLQNHSNRIVSIKNKTRYYLQYFPISLTSAEQMAPHFVVFLSELTGFVGSEEENLTEQQKLSQREEVIARYVSLGLTNKQIAHKLCISPFTVQNHLKSIFEKTGLDSRTKLANLVKSSDNLPV